MKYTKVEAVTSALRQLAVADAEEPIEGVQVESGVQILDALAAELELEGLLVWNPAEEEAVAAIPPHVYRAIVDLLKFELAPEYGLANAADPGRPRARDEYMRRIRRYATQSTNDLPVRAVFY